MKKLLIGVPTYNHKEAVDEVLSQSLDRLASHDIDICYYDGGDIQTKEIIGKYIDAGYNNILYYHFKPGVARDCLLLEKIGWPEEYEYFWFCKDRAYVSAETIDKIVNAIEGKPDVIFLEAVESKVSRGDRIYDRPELFYRDYAWLATSMDVVILRTDTMLTGMQDNTYPPMFGLHYALLFSRLAELDKVRIAVLHDNVALYNSSHATSSYKSKFFTVWAKNWVRMNEMLPAIYDPYKTSTIKKASNLPWIFGSVENLILLYSEGALTLEVLDWIEKDWSSLSDVPFDIVKSIVENGGIPAMETQKPDNTVSESLAVIDKLIEFSKAGQLTYEQIPIDNICTIIVNHLSSVYPGSNLPEQSIKVIEDLYNFYAQTQSYNRSELLLNSLKNLLLV